MSIFPLPQFEADLAEAEREAYDRLKPPTSIVVRFGSMRMIGEFPYDGGAKPGCGSKLVVRTPRGVELGEMLTSTCPNAGCGHAVTRKEMLEYIENSGGRDYPFFEDGRVLRVATIDDLNRQSQLEASRPALLKSAREAAASLGLEMKIVDAEPILSGERLTFYFTAEDRVDFRELVRVLSKEHAARIEMRQVGARDEARLIADYERCGQHCCCKQFLKVLKPVSMRAAKTQKATLDPLKISGRCGRLMCCLRYEDETYTTLRKRLPNRRTRVGTPEGPGIVLDSQILTQLVLVELEGSGRHVAVPVEELCDPDSAPAPKQPDPMRGMDASRAARRGDDRGRAREGRAPKEERQKEHLADASAEGVGPEGDAEAPAKKRRRRRRKGPQGGGGSGGDGARPEPPSGQPPAPDGEGRKRKRSRGRGRGRDERGNDDFGARDRDR